jgi:signal transduction histidine kinase
LSTLRQKYQHQLQWIEGSQQLMVRLTTASSVPEAVAGLVKSLVQEFGFDLSGAATEENLLAGDAAEVLTAADHSFIQEVVLQVRRSRELVIAESTGADTEQSLAWLMAGVAATTDTGEGPIIIVGRTRRTAAYYPVPKGKEFQLFLHLLSTVAQAFRSIGFQATYQLELERKVAERTEALYNAQKRVVELEKEKVAEQMAGGFAHEMRNALSGAKMLLEKGMGPSNSNERSVIDWTADNLKSLFLMARSKLDADELQRFQSAVREIARNERMLDDTLKSVHVSIQRALAITALIMEYSRVGFSRRGVDVIDVASIARTIISESKEACLQNHVECTLVALGPCAIRGNEAHLYSILKNLVVNAFDALCELENDRARKLLIDMDATPEQVICRVIDNANGMPEEVKTRIFEPFFSTKPQTGTGLGLGMVAKLVTLHDGTLEFDTQMGRGTTFTVKLPTALGQARLPGEDPRHAVMGESSPLSRTSYVAG